MTKHKMIAALKDKIRRLHEDKVIAELNKGMCISRPLLILCDAFSPTLISENGSRKRKKACEFLLPEKRKKPVTVTDICLILCMCMYTVETLMGERGWA